MDEHHEDITIYPPDSDEGPVVIKCRSFTLRGDIELSQGVFNVGEEEEDDDDGLFDFDIAEVADFFTSGSVQLLANRLFAEIEVGLFVEATQFNTTFALPTIGLPAFQIASVVTFGPQILPELSFIGDIQGNIDFSYGFNVSVPNDSRISINIPSFDESELAGFQDTTFQTLPFIAAQGVPPINLNITLRPHFLLGISTSAGEDYNIDGGIGAFVTLPNLSLIAEPETGIDENCQEAEGVNGARLNKHVEIDLGVMAGYDISLGSAFSDTENIETILASTGWDLDASCARVDPDSQTISTSDDNGESEDAASLTGRGGTLLWAATVLSVFAVCFCGWA